MGTMRPQYGVTGMVSGAMIRTLRAVSVSIMDIRIAFNKLCLSELPCPSQPPDVLPGEGAERNYGMEITTYRCPNGYEWVTGDWPYLEVECLNKKWSRTTLPDCRSKIKYY